MENADPQQTARVDEYLDMIRGLPEDSVSGAFPPAEPRGRVDRHDAFAATFLADAPVDGPLSEFDLAVKENVAVGGVETTCGTDCFSWTPDVDAVVVERLRAAGGALVGTTEMDPFGFGTTGEWSAGGTPENPEAAGHVPGGSSAGSAAAVAGDDVDAALGTDTAGSVRIPAAFCGVVGFKPTYGLVPAEGVVDLSPSNDHVGVLGRDVETTARVFDAVAGRAPTRPETLTAPSQLSIPEKFGSASPRLRIGIPEELMAAADQAVEARIEATLTTCITELDAETEEVSFPEVSAAVTANDAQTLMEFAALLDRGEPLGTGRGAELRAALRRTSRRIDELPDRVERAIRTGRGLLDAAPDAYGRTWDARRRTIRRQQALFNEVDLLAMPTTPMPAPELGAVQGAPSRDGPSSGVRGDDDGPTVLDTVTSTAPFNTTGAPAVTLPCGDVDGCPVGVQLVAPPGADGFLLRVAASVEQALAGTA
jgi:Asp-tRNA(Asn)/Glu-tRNA(Gln) amidotransferase A subunit family amidase